MRHSIVAIVRGNSRQMYTINDLRFNYNMSKYDVVKEYDDGLTSYKGPSLLILPPAVYRIPESHPFFNIGVLFHELRYNAINVKLPVKDLSSLSLILNYFKSL